MTPSKQFRKPKGIKSAWYRLKDSTYCQFCHANSQGFHAEECPVTIVLNEYKLLSEENDIMRDALIRIRNDNKKNLTVSDVEGLADVALSQLYNYPTPHP